MKALIGVDGSAGSFAAVAQAGTILSPDQDEVILYYAPPHLGIVSGKAPDAEILRRVERSLSDAVFEKAREQLPAGLRGRCRTLLGTQAAKHGLLVAADEQRADLVVVGARGAGPVSAVALGSVALAIAQQATLPVLIVRPRPAERAGNPWQVLLGCDNSPASQRAGQMLGKFSFPAGSAAVAATIVESLFVGRVPAWLEHQARSADSDAMARAWVTRHEAEKEGARHLLRAYCDGLSPLFAGQDPLILEGHPADEMLKIIDERKIDLVALGARGLGFLGRLLLGSTSDNILRHTHASVLIVREHEQP